MLTYLWKEKNAAHEAKKHWDLECNWEAPDERRCTIAVEAAGILQPVRDDHAKDVQCELDSDKLASGGMLSCFGSPDRNDGIENAGSPSIYQASANHPFVIHSRALQACTNSCDGSSDEDGFNTSVAVADGSTDKAANQSSEIIDRHNTSLKQRIVDHRLTVCAFVTEAHQSVVVVRGIDTTHHTWSLVR